MLLSEVNIDERLGARVKIHPAADGYATDILSNEEGTVVALHNNTDFVLVQFDDESMGDTKQLAYHPLRSVLPDIVRVEQLHHAWFVMPEECEVLSSAATNKPDWSAI